MPVLKAEHLLPSMREAFGHIAELPGGYGRLGRGDGSGVIIADSTRRLLYFFNDENEQVTATAPLALSANLKAYDNPQLEGTRVRLGYPNYNPKVLHIMGIDQGEGVDFVGGYTPDEQLTNRTLYPSVGELQNLRLVAQQTPDETVFVNPSPYYDATGAWQTFGGDSADLSSAIAALTSGQHQMAVVSLDITSGLLVVSTNTAAAGGQADKADFDWSTMQALALSANYILCGAVHLYYGQTVVTEDDIYRDSDPRAVFGKSGAGIAAAYYQTVQDNGVDQTQRGKLDFIGATVADDGANNRTTITITAGNGPLIAIQRSWFGI